MKRRAPYLRDDVTILCMDLSYGANIPDHTQHFIDLRKRRASSETQMRIFLIKGSPLGGEEMASRMLWKAWLGNVLKGTASGHSAIQRGRPTKGQE